MDKIKTLSAAIRYGSTFIGETRCWVERRDSDKFNCGCALGTPYLAVINPDLDRIVTGHEINPMLNERFKVPLAVLEDVSLMHYRQEKTRAQCADWLEQQGY